MGTVEDIAAATVYLFSPAGTFVNAESLVVDGGAWHIVRLSCLTNGLRMSMQITDAAGISRNDALS